MNPNQRRRSLRHQLLPAALLTTTAAGLIGLLDQPTPTSADAGKSQDAGSGVGTVTDSSIALPATSATAVPSSTAAAVEVTSPADAGDATSVPSTSAGAVTQPAAAAAGCPEGDTVDGDVISTRWGPVQVEAVIAADGQICDVTAIQSPNSKRKSVSINNNALPILHDEVMQAQSADIDAVSRATITSRAYIRSLQSILDRAR